MIVLLAYSLLGLGILNLNFFGVISNTVTLALFITMAILFISIIFLRLRRLRRKTGEMMIKLNKDLVTELFWIAIIFAIYLNITFMDFSHRNFDQQWYTHIFIYLLPLYVLYLSIFSKNIIGEKGIFYEDKLVTWDKIESYHWVDRKIQLRKGFTKIFIKIKTRTSSGGMDLKIDQTQKNEIEIILQKKIGSREIANDR